MGEGLDEPPTFSASQAEQVRKHRAEQEEQKEAALRRQEDEARAEHIRKGFGSTRPSPHAAADTVTGVHWRTASGVDPWSQAAGISAGKQFSDEAKDFKEEAIKEFTKAAMESLHEQLPLALAKATGPMLAKYE